MSIRNPESNSGDKTAEEAQKAALKKGEELRKAEVEMMEKLETAEAEAAGELRDAKVKEEQKWLKAEFQTEKKRLKADRRAMEKWHRRYGTKHFVKIDLLATLRDEERSRQWKPVRRASWIACFCVSVVLVWMFKLQLDIYFARSNYREIDKRLREIAPKYGSATDSLSKSSQVDGKLAALDRLTTNQYPWGPLLSAVQRTKVNGVYLTRVAIDQKYTQDDPRTIGSGSSEKLIPGATVENTSLIIQGRDVSANQEAFPQYQKSINNCDYFVNTLKSSNGFVMAGSLRPVIPDKLDPSDQFVVFVLAARFPEIRRDE